MAKLGKRETGRTPKIMKKAAMQKDGSIVVKIERCSDQKIDPKACRVIFLLQ